MAKGLNLSFVSDVSGFLRGTRDIEQALDKVSDSLDDVAREGERAGEDLASGLKDGSRDAERALEDVESAAKTELRRVGDHADDAADETEDAAKRMERSFRDSLSSAGVEAKKAGDDVATNTRRGFDDAADGAREFKDEANSTAREAAASFDGSAASIGDAFQEVAANAFAGFGPAGAVAGLGVAAGMGLGIAAIERAKEEAAETAEEVAGIASELIDLGSATRGPEQIQAALEEAATTAEDGKVALKEWADTARGAGIDFSDFAAGLAGDVEAQRRSFDEIGDGLEKYTAGLLAVREQYPNNARELKAYTDAHGPELAALNDARERLTEVNGTLDQGAEVYGLYEAALAGSTAALDDHNAKLRETAGLAMDATEAEIDFYETIEEATAKITENGQATANNTAAGRENNGALLDVAKAALGVTEAMQESGAETEAVTARMQEGREAFIRAGEAAGYTTEEAKALADQYGLIPATVDTKVTADTAQAEQDITRFIRETQARRIQMRVDANPNYSPATTYAPVRRASGGLIDGEGTDTSDQVHLRASPGEYVLDAQAVQQIGIGNLNRLNEGLGLTPPRQAAAPGLTGEQLVRALRDALSGVTWVVDGQPIQAIAQREAVSAVRSSRERRR